MVGCNGSDGGGADVGPLEGSYRSDCYAVSTYYGQETITFSGSSFTYTSTTYNDATCTSLRSVSAGPMTETFSANENDGTTFLVTVPAFSLNLLLKKVSTGFVMDDDRYNSTYDPAWDYVADGSYQEFTKQ